jgi:D-arabinose 1-dehydrogenase-like Zn-dependent alcohol dehydrogenase
VFPALVTSGTSLLPTRYSQAPTDEEPIVKAMRLHSYGARPTLDEVPEPKLLGPWDVLVDVGAAGLCRTDPHIIEDQWDPMQHPSLPYTLGHENAGRVREVGSAVHNVAPGDTVIMHPLTSCGLCPACRIDNDLVELMALTPQEKVTLHTALYPLKAADDAIADLVRGRLVGRGSLVPTPAG